MHRNPLHQRDPMLYVLAFLGMLVLLVLAAKL